jgi:hypothetical protein
LDADLAARIEGVHDLILTAGSRSDGSGRLGAWGGGAGHWRLVSAVVRGSGSPDFADSGAPVAKSSGAWVWDRLRDMRNPPRVLAGLGKARDAVATVAAALARRSSLACVRACCRNWLRSTTSSAKGPRGHADAHRGLGLAGEAAQGDRRRGLSGGSVWSSWRRSMQGVSELLDSMGRLMKHLRRCHKG